MADEQPDPTQTAPESAPQAADAAPAPAADPQPAPAVTEPQATPDPQPSASPSTSSEPPASPAGDTPPPAAVPVVVDNRTRRSDDDALLGSWVDVVAGEHQGRYGSYVATIEYDKQTGYPALVLVRTRDADNLLIEVLYQDLRPSARTGGR